MPDSLRHVEEGVRAHLEPIPKELQATCPQITVLHVISDGPVTQYRNKANFYFLSTLPFLSGFKHVTWNYSEKSHGKGAPDGIGGAVKSKDADSTGLVGDVGQKIRVNYYSPLGKRREHSEIWRADSRHIDGCKGHLKDTPGFVFTSCTC